MEDETMNPTVRKGRESARVEIMVEMRDERRRRRHPCSQHFAEATKNKTGKHATAANRIGHLPRPDLNAIFPRF